MIMDMCILSHKTLCFLMFGHVVGVGTGKLRGLPVYIIYIWRFPKIGVPPNHPRLDNFTYNFRIEAHGFGDTPF